MHSHPTTLNLVLILSSQVGLLPGLESDHVPSGFPHIIIIIVVVVVVIIELHFVIVS
jgi:hypothetical protein